MQFLAQGVTLVPTFQPGARSQPDYTASHCTTTLTKTAVSILVPFCALSIELHCFTAWTCHRHGRPKAGVQMQEAGVSEAAWDGEVQSHSWTQGYITQQLLNLLFQTWHLSLAAHDEGRDWTRGVLNPGQEQVWPQIIVRSTPTNTQLLAGKIFQKVSRKWGLFFWKKVENFRNLSRWRENVYFEMSLTIT